MAPSFGEVLRSLREAAGLTLTGLAARAYISRAAIGHVETGIRNPTADVALACDAALGTAPVLATLLALDGQGDAMKRRVLLATFGTATALAGLAGAGAVADLVSQGMLDSLGDTEDWDDVVATYSRQLVTDPSTAFGASLIGQMAMVGQQIQERGATPDRLRAAAQLGQLVGLWQGNQGQRASAHVSYRRAAMFANRSGDVPTEVYVRARTASRAIYEGMTAREVIDEARYALALSDAPTVGALEAHSALVHTNALAGNLAAGRAAVDNMRRVVDRLPDTETRRVDGPVARTVSFNAFLEGRIGDRRSADRAIAEAEPVLRPIPVWWADARIYYARALVTSGDVSDGVSTALAASRGVARDVRVVGMAVRDLLGAVPAGYQSDEVDELRSYAAPEPGPWETMV